uniref:Uncharacterized protein n=1 Tax=Oryza brachyantha TaxID=4533 RepID=J3MKN9_ORYBR
MRRRSSSTGKQLHKLKDTPSVSDASSCASCTCAWHGGSKAHHGHALSSSSHQWHGIHEKLLYASRRKLSC